MIGALLVGLVAGAIGRMLMPGDPFRHMRGPKSWGVSIIVGLVGAVVGYVIFTLGLGIGDTDVFDWGGILERDHRRAHRAHHRDLGRAAARTGTGDALSPIWVSQPA